MALVVEDGTGLTNANAFIDFAYASAYHAARGNTAWPTVQATGEIAIIKATDYMCSVYRLRWAGFRRTNTQALDFPRANIPRRDSPGATNGFDTFYDFASVPDEVKRACAELAIRSLAGDLNADLTQAIKRRTVGPITTEWDTASSQHKRFSAVEAILTPLFKSAGAGGSTSVLTRA